jgi:hypothetical protein
MTARPIAGLAAAALLAATPLSVLAQGAPTSGAATHSMQGGEQAWINDPHMHAFYDATRMAFANGPARVDVDAYEQKAFAIFRAFAPAMHMTPAGMVDHLKLIPRQVVQIVRDDPHVLDSYDNFVAATFGPR